MSKERVIGRILIQGKLHLESPLLIGTGEQGYLDILIQKDDDGLPYIPASSMCGALRHYFFNDVAMGDVDKKQVEYFWGSDKSLSDKDAYQSSFLLQDLCAISSPKVVVRDGIKIDNKWGIAEDQKKFDYEVVEPGADFDFNAEIVIREQFCKDVFLKIITTLIKALADSEIYIGSMTTKGFGRCRLTDYKVYEYDFYSGKNKVRDVISWLKGEKTKEQFKTLDFKNVFPSARNKFSLSATFNIKNSLIVKSYSGMPNESDAVHISSAGKDIIPGTSIKGALRARAVKIINTLGSKGDELIKALFGWVPEAKNDGEKQKSRLIVEEAYIKDALKETQFRTRIDRFTGGVIKTGLFDSTPIWSGEKNAQVIVNIKINDCKRWEAGLIMLLLKDLWVGDLPLGGEKSIGRGTLNGRSVKICFNGSDYAIEEDEEHLHIDGDKQELEDLVKVFVEKCGKEAREA